MVTLNHPSAGDTNWYTPVDSNWTTLESALTFPSGQIPFSNGTTLASSSSLFWDNTNSQLEVGDGSSAHPSYSFINETGSGWYRAGSGNFKFSISNVDTVRITGSVFILKGSSFLGWTPASDLTSADTFLTRDTAATLAQRNGANAQTFRVYNTFTDSSNGEWFETNWSAAANNCIVRTAANGTGTARTLIFRYGNTASNAIAIGTTVNSGVEIAPSVSTSTTIGSGLLLIGPSTTLSATSGTNNGVLIPATLTLSDGGSVSSTINYVQQISPTVNYTGSTRSGKVYLQYMNPTLTSLPTGKNGGLVFSSAFTNSGMAANLWYNTSDEDTNYERVEAGWHLNANQFNVRMTTGGTGVSRFFQFLYSDGNAASIGFRNSTDPVDLGNSSIGTAIANGRVAVGRNGFLTPASGTHAELAMLATLQDSGVNSSTVVTGLRCDLTVNYTGATRTGKVNLIRLNPTLTSQPTGRNAGIAFSSAFTSSTFPAMRFFNTSDEDTNAEWMEQGWHIASTKYAFRTALSGTGTSRTMEFYLCNTTSLALRIPTDATASMFLAAYSIPTTATKRVVISNTNTQTATSGTSTCLTLNDNFAPTSTSTMACYDLEIAPIINYSNATPGAGYVYGVYINPTNTALPTGKSAAIALSSSASALNGVVWNNQSDEQTNYEQVRTFFTSNVWTIGSYKGGTGTLRGIQVGVSGNSIGFYGGTPQAKQTVTGAKGGNAALASLLTTLANLGLLTDSTT